MKYNPEIHHRRSIRLKGYDYAQAGAYFVTVCTQNRECLFGDIVAGEMVLNDAGRMAEKWYLELANKFFDIKYDEYVIMPNHIHGVIQNVGADLRVCPDPDLRVCPDDDPDEYAEHAPGEHTGSPLPRVVQWFKTMTTNAYIHGVKQHDWPPFPGRLWQRNYYERIIRNDGELNDIREYIVNNPLKWEMDRENPNGMVPVAANVEADLCVCPQPESHQEHP